MWPKSTKKCGNDGKKWIYARRYGMAIRIRTVMNHVLNGITSGSVVSKLTKISQELWKLMVDFHIYPYIKYGFGCTDFHDSHLLSNFLCRISPTFQKKWGNWVEIKCGFTARVVMKLAVGAIYSTEYYLHRQRSVEISVQNHLFRWVRHGIYCVDFREAY